MFVIYDDFYLNHYNGPSHPENAGRLAAIKQALDGWEFKHKIVFKEPGFASGRQIEMVHDKSYIQKIMDLSENKEIFYLDADTAVTGDTYRCACLAAGGCFEGLDLIFSGRDEFNRFFALIRPPGHHAFKDRGSGFCIFNNMALSARYAREKHGIKKIAVLDFDAHHGNGTQEIFYDDCAVFYISFHQYPHYPGTGNYTETGRGRGEGFNLNFPFAPQTGDQDYLAAMIDIIIPVVERYNPDLFLVSAGYDSHHLDAMSSLNLTEESYYKIMYILSYLSRKYSKGRMGILLEGGYNYDATAKSVLETIKGCLDENDSPEIGDSKNLEEKLGISGDHVIGNVRNTEVLSSIKKIFKV